MPKKKKSKAVPARLRIAATRARRAAAGLCIKCGQPVAIRVILDASGREVERSPMSLCADCR